MNRLSRLISVAALIAAQPFHAIAADARFPDWPCVQIRVPELSVGAAWTGPAIDEALQTWKDDPPTADLVPRLAVRRTPLDEAERLAAAYTRSAPGDKEERAKLLVAGLFDTLNRERLAIVNGLERLTRRQREFARTIESEAARLRELQSRTEVDQKAVAELANRVEWSTRIFEERRKSVRFACEVPIVIEQRFFALTRAVQGALD